MKRSEAHAFIKARSIKLGNGQYMLTEPIFAFKKVHNPTKPKSYSYGMGSIKNRIANLVLPIGAIINLGTEDNLKMRASQAYCYSIVCQSTKKEVDTAVSTYYTSYVYRSGKALGLTQRDVKNLVLDAEKYVKRNNLDGSMNARFTKVVAALTKSKCQPDGFDTSLRTCGTGIHFFLDIDAALKY